MMGPLAIGQKPVKSVHMLPHGALRKLASAGEEEPFIRISKSESVVPSVPRF